jgi:hypothetical protein
MYDHSGIYLSTTTEYPFNCVWDSGHVGFIYATEETIGETMGFKIPLDDDDQKKVVDALVCEVKEYADYVAGHCFRFTIVEKDGEGWSDVMDCDIGSCGGFLGFNHEKSGLLEYARSDIDAHIRSLEEQAKKPTWKVLFSKEVVVQGDDATEALDEALKVFQKSVKHGVTTNEVDVTYAKLVPDQ